MTNLRFKRVRGIVYAGIKPFKGRIMWASMKTADMKVAIAKAKEAKLYKIQALEDANILTNAVFCQLKEKEELTVGDAVGRFLTYREDKGGSVSTHTALRFNLGQWMTMAKTAKLSTMDLKTDHFRSFFNPGDETALKTLRLRSYCCCSFCEWCVNEGFMQSNKAKAVGIDKTDMRQGQLVPVSHKPMTMDDMRRILKQVQSDAFWYMATVIGWEFGLRLSDICFLERISIVDNTLRLMTRKTGTVVNLPLSDQMVKMLNSINPEPLEHDGDFLFAKQRAEYLLYGPKSMSREFGTICKKAGVVDKSFHSLRTAFINRTFNEKKDSLLVQLAEQLAKQQTAVAAGHSSTEATDIYLKAGQ